MPAFCKEPNNQAVICYQVEQCLNCSNFKAINFLIHNQFGELFAVIFFAELNVVIFNRLMSVCRTGPRINVLKKVIYYWQQDNG